LAILPSTPNRPAGVVCRWMDYSFQIALVRLVKFTSVFAYAVGVGVGLWGSERLVRKRAVHLFASPALVAVWLSGYVLTLYMNVTIGELWIVAGFVASLLAHVLLTRAVRRQTHDTRLTTCVLVCLVVCLTFMVLRPTWWSVMP
jgi:hypothetical protein